MVSATKISVTKISATKIKNQLQKQPDSGISQFSWTTLMSLMDPINATAKTFKWIVSIMTVLAKKQGKLLSISAKPKLNLHQACT